MRGAIVFVLTVVMFATPATQVLAQTPQQHDVPSRAQPVTLNATLERSLAPGFLALPMTNPVDALLPTPNLGLAVALNPRGDALQEETDNSQKLVIGLAVLLLVALIVVVVVCQKRSEDRTKIVGCFGGE